MKNKSERALQLDIFQSIESARLESNLKANAIESFTASLVLVLLGVMLVLSCNLVVKQSQSLKADVSMVTENKC